MAVVNYPYEVKASIKTLLNISDTSQDTLIDTLLADASDAIDAYCRRTFQQFSSGTRKWDAPASNLLYIDDMYAAPTLVSIDGTALLSTEWLALPRTSEHRHDETLYTHLQRLSGGYPRAWANRGAYSVVSVTGTFGFPSIPNPVVEACQIATIRLYNWRTAKYADRAGVTADGLQASDSPLPVLDRNCTGLLKPYRRKEPACSLPAWRSQ